MLAGDLDAHIFSTVSYIISIFLILIFNNININIFFNYYLFNNININIFFNYYL